MQHTRKCRFSERSIFCVFGCVAFSGARCSPLMEAELNTVAGPLLADCRLREILQFKCFVEPSPFNALRAESARTVRAETITELLLEGLVQ